MNVGKFDWRRGDVQKDIASAEVRAMTSPEVAKYLTKKYGAEVSA